MTRDQVQNTAWDICSSASALQRRAVQWRDASRQGHLFDPAFVVIDLRETAQRFFEIAEEIERGNAEILEHEILEQEAEG
jgi:hypothetical protein